MHLEMDTRVAASGLSRMSQSLLPAQPTGRSLPATATSNPDIPMWLLSSLSDLEERMKDIAICSVDVPNRGETFGERAESYYRHRPQLLSLLQDIFNAYAYLSDRYIQTLTKKHHTHPNKVPNLVQGTVFHDFHDHEEDGWGYHIDSDAENFLSYQRHLVTSGPNNILKTNSDVSSILKTNSDISIDRNSNTKVDQLVAKLVIKNVEYDILEHEADLLGRHSDESAQKIEEQRNLLEILGCKLSAMDRLNFEIESEAIFMKEKAGELAKKMKEDQVLRNIEDLQRKISELEEKNNEYSKQLERRNPRSEEQKNGNDPSEVTQDCFSFSMFRRHRSQRELRS